MLYYLSDWNIFSRSSTIVTPGIFVLLLLLKHTNGTSIPSRTFLRQCWAPKVLLISCFLHSCSVTPDFGVQFFKDVGLIPSSMVCCKCGSQMSWCVGTNRKDGYRLRCHSITSAFACSAYTSIRHGSWFKHSTLSFAEVFLAYDIVHSYKHDREHLAACENIPQSLQPDWGLHLSPGPLRVCGGVPNRQHGPLHQVCCHHHSPHFSQRPQYVRLWHAHYHGWCMFICGALHATTG